MLDDRPDIAARNRSGQRGIPHPKGVVDARVEQRPQDPIGVLDTGAPENLHRLGNKGDRIVCAVDETQVVADAIKLIDRHRFAAHLDNEGFRHGK